MTKEKALLLDVTYFDDKEASIISLFVQREGKHYWLKDNEFRPYFYVLSGFSEKEKVVRDIKGFEFGVEEKFNVLRVEDTNKSHNSKSVIKIVFNKVSQLISARKILSEMGFERYEYDVPYAKRYLIDNRLEPGNFIEYEVILEEKINSTKKEVNAKDFESEEGELVSGEGKIVKEISVVEGNFEGKGLAFDLETYSREKFGIGFEPIIMTSIVSSDLDSESKEKSYERVLSYNTASVKGLELVSDEKELIKETIKELNKKENSFVITYNGDNFDFAYLKERARKNKLEFKVNNSFVKSVRHGRDNAVKLLGVQHIDSFQIIKLLARTGAINTVKMDIETISEKVFGEFKEKVYPSEINEAWEEKNEEKLERLVDYNLKDSRTALRIAKEFLPLFVELSKLTSQTLYETTRSTTSQMVEDLLLKEAHLRGMIAPNKPKEGEIQERSNNPIKGAFVKEPTSGLHENIAVLDFASLYPSIIISHNLSPETLNCGHEECKQKNSTPDGTWFCTKQKGLFPEILEKMLKQRLVLKREYKRKKKEEGIDDKILFAKQWALKIVLNSVYGYLAYARARWYSRECASATTALARGYIQETIKKAEKTGFEVLYGDSITKNRFITVLNPKGQIEVKNVEQLFNEINAPVIFVRGKEVKSAKGYCALSVNTDTRKAEWAKINEIIRHKTDKLVFRVNQKFGETICTEDHSIITEDNFVLKETKPQEMNGRKFFSVQSIPQSKEINEIDLFELLKSQHYKRIYKNQDEVSQWDCDGNYITFGFKGFGDRIKLKRFIKVGSREFEALCRLLGAYIAEGSSSTLETTYSRFGASIASSNIAWLKELEKDYHLLFNGAKTCVIPSNKKKRTLTYGKDSFGKGGKTIEYFDTTHKLQMMNTASAQFFKGLCGQKSVGKKLPDFIFNVHKKYKILLLEKMVEGDGSHAVNKKLGYKQEYVEKNFSYTSKSLEVASGLSLLLRQLGRNYSIRYRQGKQAYTIQTSDNSNSRVITKIVQEKYEGFVYDLSVEKNNNFVDACGQVLLHNTDSNFLKMLDKTKKDVEEFVEKVNKDLPEGMELELDGFYKRGIFVTKKEGGAAKKKYALIDEKGNLKIVGFEYVRRDWCNAAKDTQKKVIELVLNEGKPEKAISFVKKMLADLKEGKVAKKDLVIMTLLQRDVKDYDSIGPHVAAAKKAIKRGKELGVGSMLSFIITKGKGKMSISEKAELEEYVSEGDYDADYYIENQVLPAVIKIMQELGYTKEDLINGGKQSGLGAWC